MDGAAALQSYLCAIPRKRLGHLPTPIEAMERPTAALGGPALYVERDDLTGFGCGANKVRSLEYLVPDALAKGADVLVTAGVVQSNSTRQVAAAAARLGLACHVLVIADRVEPIGNGDAETGNALLGRLFGATTEVISIRHDREQKLEAAADRLRADGRTPYVIPYGCSNLLGATGYLNAASEIARQAETTGLPFTHVVHASGTGGTQAGLSAGFEALGLEVEVIGSDVDADHEGVHSRVTSRLVEPAAALGLRPDSGRIDLESGYAAGAYGAVDESTVEAIHMAAQLEALTVDPVYSGKGLAGLIGLTRTGRVPPDARVLFVHTGGGPALLAYPSLL
jgi:L-cysteate sulfo-lyase